MNNELKDKILNVLHSTYHSDMLHLTKNDLEDYLITFKKQFPQEFVNLITQIISNSNEHGTILRPWYTLGDIICNSFSWNISPEGEGFWDSHYSYFMHPEYQLRNFTKITQICMPDE